MKTIEDIYENKIKIEKLVYSHFFFKHKKYIESGLKPEDIINIRYCIEKNEITGIRINYGEIILLEILEKITGNIL